MSEGAVTINRDGIILYCNTRFAEMADTPLEKTIGMPLASFVPRKLSKDKLKGDILSSWKEDCRQEIILKDGGG
jgi:two-component system phosphate regulon sensor histidine kinase PhoR